MEIAGTTIAMGAPHTITYTIHISLDTAKLQKFSPEDTAANWIKDNCDNIFADCSDAYKAVITKDGDTYTIPYRASDNTIIASGIKLLRPDKSLYQSGWFFSTTKCFSRPSKTSPTSATYSFSNVRFISQTDTKMTATLKLYDPATPTTAIKNNTATALASYTYTWIVQPKIEPYSVTLEAKDADGNLVTDPVYTVTDNYGNVITSSDAAVYQLYADRTYTITASAEDYTAEDGSEQAVIKDFIPSQDETKTFTLTQSPEAKAQKWIKDNCDNIFAGCSDAYKAVITKDGDTYTIPYRASDNTIIASGIKLLRPDKSLYQSGWFFSTTKCFSRPSKTSPTSATYSFSNVRFISQTDTKMTATLKLYDPATPTTAIKNNTATALASYTYTWIVQPKIEPYSVTLEAKDADGNLVTDPVYTVTDNYGNVITSSDAAVYQLYADRTYTITASAENHTAEDGSEQAVIKDFTPSQDDCITFTLKNKSVALEDGTYTINTISDSTMFAFYNTKIIVKDKKAYLVVTLKGTGFDRLYMGDCSESSVRPAEEDTICYAPEQFDGSEHYTFWPVPIVSLNDPLSISGHSAKKDTWYHHTITFDQNTLKKISDDNLVPSEKMEAQKLMRQYYIDGNVIVKNKEVCQKSKQTYQIPYYEADGSTPLTEFTLKRPDTARFKSSWKFETTEAANCFTDKTQQGFSTPSVGQNYTLKEQRPTSAATINATLSFYSPTETDAAIDAGTAVVLASTEVTFVIAPKATAYQIKFLAVNSFTQDILPDARITVVDQNGNTLTPGANGTYTLNDATSYTVTASQNGYVGAGGKEEAYLVFVPSKE